MQGIKISTVLTLKLNGLRENEIKWAPQKCPNFDSKCPGSRGIAKTYVAKVLLDTLYSPSLIGLLVICATGNILCITRDTDHAFPGLPG